MIRETNNVQCISKNNYYRNILNFHTYNNKKQVLFQILQSLGWIRTDLIFKGLLPQTTLKTIMFLSLFHE